MADISDINSAQTVKLVGSDSSGVEQTPVQSTTSGAAHINVRNNSGTEIGTATDPIRIDPTGTTTQPVSGTVTAVISGSVIADQGDPNTLGNAWPVKITDASGGSVAEIVKESDNYSNSDHGFLFFGVDDSSPSRKVKPVKVDQLGHLNTHILDDLNNQITSTLVGAKQSLDVNVSQSALPSGASTSANQDTTNTRIGDLTETAPITDTASSGLNGRLQRIAQRITDLITATTNKTQWTKITDGTNDGTFKASSIPAALTDTSLVTSDSPFQYRYIKAAATTVIKSGSGVLHSISIVSTANGTATVYDNTAGSGTIIALVGAVNGTAPSTLTFNVAFTTGLTIVTSSASPAFTVSWK